MTFAAGKSKRLDRQKLPTRSDNISPTCFWILHVYELIGDWMIFTKISKRAPSSSNAPFDGLSCTIDATRARRSEASMPYLAARLTRSQKLDRGQPRGCALGHSITWHK